MLRTVRAFLTDLLALTLGFAVASLSMTVLVAARSTDPLRTAAPAGTVLSPLQGQTVSGTVVVSATASQDTDALQFQLNGANLGPTITSGLCSMNWNTAALTDGAYALTVLAFDGGGNVASSAAVAVTVANSAPQITDVATSNATATAVVLTWTTNQLSTSGADYGISALTSSLPINWNLVTQHSALLTGLSPGTTYRFRVTSANGSGLQAGSAEFAFTTASIGPADPSPGTPGTNRGETPVTPPPGGTPGSPIARPPGLAPFPAPPPGAAPAPPVVPSTPAPAPPVASPAPTPGLPGAPPPPGRPLVEPTTIDSVAVDPALGVLANVPVMLERSGKVIANTTTDSNGKFRFTGLFPGRYKVWALYGGARILILDLTIRDPPGVGTPGVLGRRSGQTTLPGV